jgi:CDGSH-type Zn-finger protein
MAQVTITLRPNGPLRIDDPNGVVEVVDAEGNKFDLTGKPAFSLCRCGASANKPFCDGSHKAVVPAPAVAIKSE